MNLHTFKTEPTEKELDEFSDNALIARCKDKFADSVWVVLDFNNKIENGNENTA